MVSPKVRYIRCDREMASVTSFGQDMSWGWLRVAVSVKRQYASPSENNFDYRRPWRPTRISADSPFINIGTSAVRAARRTQKVTPTIYKESPVKGSLDRRRYSGITMKKKPALAAVPFVESQWLRWIIQDEKDRYWMGRRFSKDQRQALTYADSLVVVEDMRRILRRRCKGLIRYRLVAPVIIDVYADSPIDQEEMAWFLSQNCFVSMSRLGTGEGPGDSIVLPLVDWSKLKMMKG